MLCKVSLVVLPSTRLLEENTRMGGLLLKALKNYMVPDWFFQIHQWYLQKRWVLAPHFQVDTDGVLL